MSKSFVAALLSIICASTTAASNQVYIAFTNECPVTGQNLMRAREETAALAAFGAAVASKFIGGLVDNGVDALLAALKPHARALSSQTAENGFYFGSRISPSMACLVAVVGQRAVGKPAVLPSFPGQREEARSNVGKLFKLEDDPVMYVEAALRVSPDNTAIVWSPQYVLVNRFLINNAFAGSNRDALITVKLSDVNSNTFGEFSLSLKAITEGYAQDYRNTGSNNLGAWGTVPAFDAASSKSSSGLDRLSTPFTATVSYVETPKPGLLGRLFVGALESQATPLKSALKEVVVQSDRETRSANITNANKKAIDDFVTAFDEYQTNCGKIETQQKLLSCKVSYLNLKTKQSAAILAVGALGAAFPLTEADLDIGPPPQKQ
jgi:hypothetical protein